MVLVYIPDYLYHSTDNDRTYRPAFHGGFLQANYDDRECSLETGMARRDISYKHETYAYIGSRTDYFYHNLVAGVYTSTIRASMFKLGDTEDRDQFRYAGIMRVNITEQADKKLYQGSRLPDYFWIEHTEEISNDFIISGNNLEKKTNGGKQTGINTIMVRGWGIDTYWYVAGSRQTIFTLQEFGIL